MVDQLLTDMHDGIERECQRLGVPDGVRALLIDLARRLDSLDDERIPASLFDVPVPKTPVWSRSRALLLKTLHDLESGLDRHAHLLLLSSAISTFPVMYERVRRDGPDGPEFWDPLHEPLDQFVERAPTVRLRRYVSESPIQALDVLRARVYGILTGADRGAPSAPPSPPPD